MGEQTKAVRRIVTIDDAVGKSLAIADGPPPDVQGDPARPGFTSVGTWVTDSSPARIGEYREPIFAGHGMEPPRGGSLCRVVTFPPDATFRGKVGANEVAAFFR